MRCINDTTLFPSIMSAYTVALLKICFQPVLKKWPAHTDRFLSDIAPRKKLSEHSFLLVCFIAYDPIFYRCKIEPTLRFFIRVSFGAYGPIFYRSYCAVPMAGEFTLFDHVTPFSYRTSVGAQVPIFYRGQIVGWKSPSQTLAHTIRFSLFLSTIKNRSVCALHAACLSGILNS